MTTKKAFRCAIYTRKSHEEGLEQEFNSLHAQREACEAYIKSQKHEGWQIVKTAYDDGGFTGGNMERPALKQLLADITAGKIDVIVVYKVDRLSRSLHDFAKMVEVFDKHAVSFVSVTQQFNTTTSMGRLTLNVLLSFAQFEREVTGERIRDKIAASKKKGMWMGGFVPLGYDAVDRKLIINAGEAKIIRGIYQRYLELGCVRLLKEELDNSNTRSKNRTKMDGTKIEGSSFSRGNLYKILSNPIYIGQIRHKDTCHLGQHDPIIEQALWEQVQQRLNDNAVKLERQNTKADASLLMGKLFDELGEGLTPSHANKKGKRYRYYVSKHLTVGPGSKDKAGWRLPAQEIENAVVQAMRQILVNQVAITDALRDAGVDTKRIPAIMDTAKAVSRRLNAKEDVSNIIATILSRIVLQQGSMCITLSLASLIPNAAHDIIMIQDIPMQLQRRGIEARLMIGGADTVRSDPALIRTIAFARMWFEELESGRAKNIAEIAQQYGFSEQYVSNLLPLAFLAPQIVRAIETGKQPAFLTAEVLVKQIDLPFEWGAQKRVVSRL